MKMKKGLVVLMVLVGLLGFAAIAANPPTVGTISTTSPNSSSAVPWSPSMTDTGTYAQIQVQVVNIWSRIKKRAGSMFRDTMGIVLDEVGDVMQYMTKRLHLTTSYFGAMKMDQTSIESAFATIQSLSASGDSFYHDGFDAREEVKGPGDPGATMSRVCGMKMIHEDCDYHAPGDPPVTTEVFCQVP
jgi:hypothetical protein